MKPLCLAFTLQDAVAAADRHGIGCIIGIGEAEISQADILTPAGPLLQPIEVGAALRRAAPRYSFSFGSGAASPTCRDLAPLLETLAEVSGAGFMAACFAAPAQRRTVYQGHMFQDGRLRENLIVALSAELSGRVGLVPHHITKAGPVAIHTNLTALKDQGYVLAVVDALDAAECAAVGEAFAQQLITGNPAWPCHADPAAALAAYPNVILSGALDRQTLYQIGAAATAMPVLQLDFMGSEAELVASALAWAAKNIAQGPCIIAASAPPDKVHPGAPAALILAEIAAGLKAAGVSRLLLTGNNTAAAILRRLGITRLVAGGVQSGLRALHANETTVFIKPSGFGGRNLFLSQIGPHSRLNEAAE